MCPGFSTNRCPKRLWEISESSAEPRIKRALRCFGGGAKEKGKVVSYELERQHEYLLKCASDSQELENHRIPEPHYAPVYKVTALGSVSARRRHGLRLPASADSQKRDRTRSTRCGAATKPRNRPPSLFVNKRPIRDGNYRDQSGTTSRPRTYRPRSERRGKKEAVQERVTGRSERTNERSVISFARFSNKSQRSAVPFARPCFLRDPACVRSSQSASHQRGQ